MESVELLSLIISLVALAVSGYLTHEANKKADRSIQLSQQTTKFDAVMHFTDRFFELLKVGNVDETEASLHRKILNDSAWAYQFWSLHATEFYFFHNGVLPDFMYSLWMVDLAKMYASDDGEKIWKSHSEYLSTYSSHYDDMCDFFEELYKFARSQMTEGERNENIADFVHTWREKNRPRQIEQTAFA